MFPKIKIASNRWIEYIPYDEPIVLAKFQDNKCAICHQITLNREEIKGIAEVTALGKIVYLSYNFFNM